MAKTKTVAEARVPTYIPKDGSDENYIICINGLPNVMPKGEMQNLTPDMAEIVMRTELHKKKQDAYISANAK